VAVHDAVESAGSGGGPVPLGAVGEAGGRIAANIERVIDGKPEWSGSSSWCCSPRGTC